MKHTFCAKNSVIGLAEWMDGRIERAGAWHRQWCLSRVTILGDFSPILLLLEAHDFFKDEVAQRNGNILGYFLLKQIHYFFT